MGSKDYQAYTGEVITFEASKRFYKSYQWDFGDGTMTPDLVSRRATHKFEEAGSYLVSLTVYDELDNKPKTITADVTVKDSKIQMMKKYWALSAAALLFVFTMVDLLGFDGFW